MAEQNKQSTGKDLDARICKYIAFGLIATGVEGAYDGYNPSTGAEGYPAIGVSGWTSGRMQTLLGMIPGGDKYQGKTASDFENDPGLKQGLLTLLDSPAGQKAQQNMLANDTVVYIDASKEVGIIDPKVLIYVGMWQPTSTSFAASMAAQHGGNNLNEVHNYFKTQYYIDAKVGSEYAAGYSNRADKTLAWVNQCNLSKDPDPNMIIDFEAAYSGTIGKSSDSGFEIISHGKTVTIVKLPKQKTFCEPIYPDLITVGDTVPEWIMQVYSEKKEQKAKEQIEQNQDNNKQQKNKNDQQQKDDQNQQSNNKQ